MHPRQMLSPKGLPPYELPILPFLAPRVFKPWSKILYGSRTHATLPGKGPKANFSTVENLPSSPTNHENETLSAELLRAHASNTPRWLDTQHPRASNGRTKHDEPHGDQERFRRAFEDIWGSQRAKRRFQDQVSLRLEGVKDVGPSERKRVVHAIVQEKGRKPRPRAYNSRRVTVREEGREPRFKFHAFKRVIFKGKGVELRPRISGFSGFHLCKRAQAQDGTQRQLLSSRRSLYFTRRRMHRVDSSLLYWSARFTRLCRIYNNPLGQKSVSLSPITFTRKVNWTHILRFLSNASVDEVKQEWKALSQTERDVGWFQMMVGVLQRHPKLALKFLAATSFRPYPPSYAVSDSLQYIVCYYLHNIKDTDIEIGAFLFPAVIELLDHFDGNYLLLTQKTIFLLLSNLTSDHLEQFYTILVQRDHPITDNTLLHFANALARGGRTQSALNALQRFYDMGGDFTEARVESVCNTVLQRRYRGISDDSMSDSDTFRHLLDLGLQPNIKFYNTLIKNAVEEGHPESAWAIHDMMLGHGINADAHTYSILLNDAKLRGDRSAMDHIVDLVQSKKIINQYIITDLLHAIFMIYEIERSEAPSSSPPPPPLNRMLPLYCEYFDVEPIKDLLSQVHGIAPPQPSRAKLHPPKETLVIMLTALLRGFTSSFSASEWYNQFRKMVLEGHSDIAPLVESTHIYDAIIMCLGRWSEALHLCTKVIGDMHSSYSAARGQQAYPEKESGSIRHCKPSVRTWSVFLKAFMDHNQPRAAEKVLTIMRSQGITPNQVTWNSLAIGYARLQDIPNTVHTIARFEGEGWEADRFTIGGLRAVKNRQELIQALEENKQQRAELASLIMQPVDKMVKEAKELYNQERRERRRASRIPSRKSRSKSLEPAPGLNQNEPFLPEDASFSNKPTAWDPKSTISQYTMNPSF